MTLKIGMRVRGIVTGIQPYGVFVDLGNQSQGLIHISECKAGYVEDINKLFHVGEEVVALVIDIDEFSGKISLSTRSQKVDQGVLRQPHVPYFVKNRYWTNYRLKLGFSTIAQERSRWLSEAKRFFE